MLVVISIIINNVDQIKIEFKEEMEIDKSKGFRKDWKLEKVKFREEMKIEKSKEFKEIHENKFY